MGEKSTFLVSRPPGQDELPYREALRICARLLKELIERGAQARAVVAEQKKGPQSVREQLRGKVLVALGRHGPLSPAQLRAIVGCSPMTMTRALHELVQAGKITPAGQTRARVYESRCTP